MNKIHDDIKILGSGLSGLSYAYGQIMKKNSVDIFEKEGSYGGLMKSFLINGHTFDFGPHVFRSKDEKTLNFVKYLLNDGYNRVVSNPKIFKNNKLFDGVIPTLSYSNINLLSPILRKKVEKETREITYMGWDNFKDKLISQLGETLYWEFFGEYSKKWWGVDPEKLSTELAPKISINNNNSYGHITTNFQKPVEEIYPLKNGIFSIIRSIYDKISLLGAEIKLRSNVVGFETDANIISKIIISKESGETEIDSKNSTIVSTIPLPYTCKILNIKNDLKYRGDICVFIKINGSRILKNSWLYFHDSDVLFSRVYEPIFFSKYNAPKGFTALCAEVTCFKDDKHWSDKYIGERIINQLLELRIIKKSHNPEILGIEKNANAYPIYDIHYKKNKENIMRKITAYKNIKVIGRTGSFSYENMAEGLTWAVY